MQVRVYDVFLVTDVSIRLITKRLAKRKIVYCIELDISQLNYNSIKSAIFDVVSNALERWNVDRKRHNAIPESRPLFAQFAPAAVSSAL